MQEHFLKAGHRSPATVEVGRPVEAGIPEGRVAVRTISELLAVQPSRFVGESEAGSPDVVLLPPFRVAHGHGVGVFPIGVAGDVKSLASHAVYAPGEDGIELGGLCVLYAGPCHGGGDAGVAIDDLKGDGGNALRRQRTLFAPRRHGLQGGDGARGVVCHLVGLATRTGVDDEVPVFVKGFRTKSSGLVLVMFVEEPETFVCQWGVSCDENAVAGATGTLEGHQSELQRRVPFIFQPGVVFHAGVAAVGVLAVFRGVGQTEILHLFGERCAAVSPVVTGARHGGGQKAQVGVQLHSQQVVVAALHHGPIDQALVLSRHRAAAPFAVVGGERVGRRAVILGWLHMFRVEGEETAIELSRPLPIGVAT